MIAICKFIEKRMAYLVVFAALVAAWQPTWVTWIVPHISLLLMLIMFGMGTTLEFKDFSDIFTRPKQVLIGIMLQFTIMPLVAFVLTKIFNMPMELAIGVILVGASPGGTASNVMTYLAKGDLALSVAVTASTTILAPIVTPFLVGVLANTYIEISFVTMMISIAKIVLAPVILGLLARHFMSSGVDKITPVLPALSSFFIIMIIAAVVGASIKSLLTTGILVFALVILHNCSGLVLGYLGARIFGLNEAKRRTLAIEVGMQNSALAVALAVAHFSPEAALPGAVFSVWHNLSGSLLASYFANRLPTVEVE